MTQEELLQLIAFNAQQIAENSRGIAELKVSGERLDRRLESVINLFVDQQQQLNEQRQRADARQALVLDQIRLLLEQQNTLREEQNDMRLVQGHILRRLFGES